jgi:nicotinamide mononucleotide transporter
MSIIPSREQGLKKNIAQGVVLGILLTAMSYAVGLGFGWIDSLSLLEAFAVFTSYVCTYLCVMERRINYPIGAVSTMAYCVLFYQYGLMASMAINGFLVVYLIYGYYRWRSDEAPRAITRMGVGSWAVSILVAGLGYLVVVLLASALGGQLAWTDSFILAGTILAQFMMDNKKLENWVIWALVNVFAIYTYFNAGLTLAGFQYIFFLLNTFYGFYVWKRAEVRKEKVSIEVGELVHAKAGYHINDRPESRHYCGNGQEVS